MQEIPQPPQDCGRRLIPSLVDSIASSDPSRTFVSIPKTSDIEDGFVDVTYSTLARAVNRCAWWIENQLGRSENQKTLSYIGPLDIRYPIIMLAASKTGHVAFFSSHRNSLEAHLSLLNATKCDTMLLPAAGAPAITKKILAAKEMQVLTTPELDYFLSDDGNVVETYPFKGTFEEMRFKPFVILHTSGSTGIPKPVFCTHGTFASSDAHQLIPSLGGKPGVVHYLSGKRCFVALPLFHAASLGFTVAYGIYAGLICVLPPPGPVNLDVVNKMHSFGNVEGSLLPPSTIIDIYRNPDYFANMKQQLKFVVYAGGSLPMEIGDPISPHVRVITMLGSSENLFYPADMEYDNEDWSYIPIPPALGCEFRPARDGLYELVFVKNSKYDLVQGVFATFPALKEYPTNDLFERHPTKPNSWGFRARGDDIICFSNAEKLNPVTMECIISAHPAVRSAIIGGTGEFQASLLIEPMEDPTTDIARQRLLNDIWPSIMKANRDCPAHGRIMKEFVMFTKSGVPLPRSGKGTVQRSSAMKLYATEFKALYAPKPAASEVVEIAPVNGSTTTSEPKPASSSIDLADLDAHIEKTLQRILPQALSQHLGPAFGQMIAKLFTAELPLRAAEPASYREVSPVSVSRPDDSLANGTRTNGVTKSIPQQNGAAPTKDLKTALYCIISDQFYVQDLSDSTDLFEGGLDSLQLPALVTEINAFLTATKPGSKSATKKMVYENPTISELVTALEK